MLGSLVLHAAFLVWVNDLLPVADGAEWIAATPLQLELLSPPVPVEDTAAAVVSEPPAPEPVPSPALSELSEEPLPPQSAELVQSSQTDEPDSAIDTQIDRQSAPRLNLSRPDNWETLALEPPEVSGSIAFKKSTRDAVAARRAEQATRQALSRATIARLGLPEEEFRRMTDAGETVKTAKGCFVKRVEHGPSGRQERWWRTACVDSRVKPWRREVLTFGPDHRLEVVPESGPDSKSDCSGAHCWAY